MRRSEAWHEKLYDDLLLDWTIDSPRLHSAGKAEAKLLVRALKLRRGDRILDVPCGTGRHAVAFAKAGLRVTGIDLNRDCLRRARKNARGLEVRFKRGNIASLRAERGLYDAVVNLFTSFGYFGTDGKNEQVMRGLVAALKPGGRIVIHVVNGDFVRKSFAPVKHAEHDGKLVTEFRSVDAQKKFISTYVVFMDKKTLVARGFFFRLRLYSKSEMVRLMKRCGLKQIKVLGDFKGAQFNERRSIRPIYIGTKYE
jgi:SAM-dependent methyltransferase